MLEHRRYNFFKFFCPIILMGAIRYSCPILIKLNSKFRNNSNMLFPSVGVYMLKHKDIICFILFSTNFPIVPMAAILNGRPILIKLNSKLELTKKCYFQA